MKTSYDRVEALLAAAREDSRMDYIVRELRVALMARDWSVVQALYNELESLNKRTG